MPAGIFLRIIIAIVCALVAFALIGPVSRLLGFPVSGDFEIVLRVCIAAAAVLYIVRGRP